MLIPGQFFGKQIMGIFVQDADVIAIGAKRICNYKPILRISGNDLCIEGNLKWCGDAAYSMINGFMEITGRVALPLPLTMIPAIGMWACSLRQD